MSFIDLSKLNHDAISILTNDVPHLEPVYRFLDNGELDIDSWDGKTRQFTKLWTCTYKDEHLGFIMKFHKGFITDLGTVPRIFKSMVDDDGIYRIPFLLHDGLYAGQYVDRKSADIVLYNGFLACDAWKITALGVYHAVRLGANRAFKNHAYTNGKLDKDKIKQQRQLVEIQFLYLDNNIKRLYVNI